MIGGREEGGADFALPMPCRSTDDEYIGEELRKHVREPYFLPPHSSDTHLAWIFMGAPGKGASLHVRGRGRERERERRKEGKRKNSSSHLVHRLTMLAGHRGRPSCLARRRGHLCLSQNAKHTAIASTSPYTQET